MAAAKLRQLVARRRTRSHALVGVGVAVPGMVDSKTGLVQMAANLGWRNVNLRALLEQRLKMPVGVEHLARAKARAEALWGHGRGHHNFICLEIGSGVGAGVVADGRMLRGATASAGEVGHIVLDPAGPPCFCNQNGCWELYCSGPAIRQRLAGHLASEPSYKGPLTAASTLADLGVAAENSDPLARRVIDETAGYLLRGLLSLICVFDPELIILSGLAVRDCPALLAATEQALRKVQSPRSLDIPLVAQTADAGVIAASAIVSVRHVRKLASG